MEKLLNDNIANQVRQVFATLEEPVAMLYFYDPADEHAQLGLQLYQEVVTLSDKLSLSAYDQSEAQEWVETYRLDKFPALVIARNSDNNPVDHGVRIFGVPSGHEFSSLIHSLVIVSQSTSSLSEETIAFLNSLEQPVKLEVFSTPTCPYCPRAVLLANQFAMASPKVEASLVDATQFMELSYKYNVGSVPHTEINEGAGSMIGAAPEDYLIQEIKQALGLN